MRLPSSSTPPKPDLSSDPRYFEQYKLAVEMADRLSARRGTTNAFYATLNAGLVTAVGLLRTPATDGIPLSSEFAPLLGASAGLALCVVWFLTLRSYRHLSGAKWQIILEMEKRLPAQAFGDEWDRLPHEERRWRDRYQPLSTSERVVPWLFGGVYALALLMLVLPSTVDWLGR